MDISRKISSKNGIVTLIPFDLVAPTSRPRLAFASSKAYRMILYPASGKDALLDGDLIGRTLYTRPPEPQSIHLRYSPDDRDIQVVWGCERTLHAAQESCGAQIYVLVEGAPYGEQEPPEGEMVGHRGPADGAEVDLIVGRQGIEAVFEASYARAPGSMATPREPCKVETTRASCAAASSTPACRLARPLVLCRHRL